MLKQFLLQRMCESIIFINVEQIKYRGKQCWTNYHARKKSIERLDIVHFSATVSTVKCFFMIWHRIQHRIHTRVKAIQHRPHGRIQMIQHRTHTTTIQHKKDTRIRTIQHRAHTRVQTIRHRPHERIQTIQHRTQTRIHTIQHRTNTIYNISHLSNTTQHMLFIAAPHGKA